MKGARRCSEECAGQENVVSLRCGRSVDFETLVTPVAFASRASTHPTGRTFSFCAMSTRTFVGGVGGCVAPSPNKPTWFSRSGEAYAPGDAIAFAPEECPSLCVHHDEVECCRSEKRTHGGSRGKE